MLDKVDKELKKRGHKFCRFADDCNVYVKSRKARLRLMKSLKDIIEGKLRIKVNENKSAVDSAIRRKFLGFSFYFSKGGVQIRVHPKSYNRFKEKIRKVTKRNSGINMDYKLKKLNEITVGWINYFCIAKAKVNIKALEKWIRGRLRDCSWKQWKKIKTKFTTLRKLRVNNAKAWQFVNRRKGYWRVSNSHILNTTLDNNYLESLGYKSILRRYQQIHRF
jgi:RNA-directed DNA polymerase